MAELIPYAGGEFAGDLSTFACQPKGLVSLDEWHSILNTFATVEDGHQLWIGDMLNYGAERYGEKYAQYIPANKAETWRQYAWTASRVRPKFREQCGSYTKIRILAGADPEHHEKILSEREPAEMTTREFTALVSRYKPAAKSNRRAPLMTWREIKEALTQEGIGDDTLVSISISESAEVLEAYFSDDRSYAIVKGHRS